MKIAYLILAHKNPKQVKDLVEVLIGDNDKVFIHIDKKSKPQNFEKVIRESFGYENNEVFFISPKKTYWSSITITEARLALLNKAISLKDWSPDYIVMLSGQTFPIKPKRDFKDFLINNKGFSFIEHFPLPTTKLANGGLDRINCYSFSIFGKRISHFPKGYHSDLNLKGKIINILLSFIVLFFKKRSFPQNMKPFYGIDWWVITNSAAKTILDFIKIHPRYHSYHKYTRHACEVYFPSILANSENQKKILRNNSLHFMIWEDGAANPKILKKEFFSEIDNSDSFFARKFDITIDSEVIEMFKSKIS